VYVAGSRGGRIPETVERDYSPRRDPSFDAARTIEELRALIRDTERRADTDAVVPAERSNGKALTDAQRRKARTRWVRQELTRLGTERALYHGWTNTYTLTKSLAESLLERCRSELPIAIVRPSIVETSTHAPFPGWNEGVNTSAPLSWLCATHFRQLPTRPVLRLDVIPVDLVTRGMNLIAAALVRRAHHFCYQLATSSSNPCDVARTIELTALAHRQHYRDRPGLDAWLRSHNETIPVSMRRYRAFSAPGQKAIVRTLRRVLPLTSLKRTERNLDRVEKLIELFEPFIHDNDYTFEADHIGLLDAALAPEEREALGYDAAAIDWLEYWTAIHIPALRKWSYPLIEGRPVEA
jgi:long-chain acyl-CoA synthetase